LFFAIYLFFFIFPAIASIQAAQANQPNEACNYTIGPVGSGLGALFVTISFITLAVRLRKVHDGYFIKNEFKLLSILGVIIIILFIAIELIPSIFFFGVEQCSL